MLDRFRTFSTRSQLLLVGAVAAVLLAVMLLSWLALREPYQPLFTQLRAADAATIIADLDKRKIDYRLADGGATVLVPADAVAKTRLTVMTGDLPLKGTVGFELFNKADMGLTDFAQRINFQRALQGELERTIMTFDNIESARVHLSLGEDRLFREDRVAPKASVSIRMRDGATMDDAAAAGIQRLVAAAVPRLEPDAVVILDDAGDVITAATQSQPPADIAPRTAEQQAIGKYYEAKIRTALERNYPAGAIAVSVIPILADTAAMDSWDPAARTFPLAIVLAPNSTLDAGAKADVRAMTAEAVTFDAGRGDSINFGSIGAPQFSASMPPRKQASHPMWPVDTVQEKPVSPVSLFAWIGGGIVLLFALLLVWRRRPDGHLTEVQRAQLVARLKSALDGEDGHAQGI
jgi:flagellar M-ring protein FliF